MKARPSVPEDLSPDEKRRLVAWVKERQEQGDFDWIDHPRMLRRHVDECLAHHAATGNRHGYVDFYRCCQKWLVKAQEIRERDRQAGKREAFVNLDQPMKLRVVK